MTELEKLQAQRRALEQDVQRAESLLRLRINPDFATVVLQGFLRDASLDAISESVQCRDKDARYEALQKARAGGFLQAYFGYVQQRGDYARRALREMQATRESDG